MKIEIVEKVDHMPERGHYFQKTLPTEHVFDGREPLLPENFTMMRLRRASLYMYDGVLIDYNSLRDLWRANDHLPQGTGEYNEAYYAEHWEDYGDDGHVDWEHMGTYLVLFEDKEPWLTVHQASGSDIQRALSDAVYALKEES